MRTSPRALGIAWGLGKGKSTKTVLRAGFGVFYDRFGEGYILNAERLERNQPAAVHCPLTQLFPQHSARQHALRKLGYAHDLSN